MKYIAILFSFLFIFHCKNTEEISQDKIVALLQERRLLFIEEKIKTCNKILMDEIEIEADSILIFMSKKIKYDSLSIPYDSIRPEKPQVLFPGYKKPEKPNLDSLIQ